MNSWKIVDPWANGIWFMISCFVSTLILFFTVILYRNYGITFGEWGLAASIILYLTLLFLTYVSVRGCINECEKFVMYLRILLITLVLSEEGATLLGVRNVHVVKSFPVMTQAFQKTADHLVEYQKVSAPSTGTVVRAGIVSYEGWGGRRRVSVFCDGDLVQAYDLNWSLHDRAEPGDRVAIYPERFEYGVMYWVAKIKDHGK